MFVAELTETTVLGVLILLNASANFVIFPS